MIVERTLTDEELQEYDRTYREGGLRAMASPHVHYHGPLCPHGCGHRMEWIDFMLETYGVKVNFYDPLVRSFWEGIGFAGRCPSCRGWIRFRTLKMDRLNDSEASQLPRLSDHWHTVPQFA